MRLKHMPELQIWSESLKVGSCSGYREFVYHMDCEDGGDTRAEGGYWSNACRWKWKCDISFFAYYPQAITAVVRCYYMIMYGTPLRVMWMLY